MLSGGSADCMWTQYLHRVGCKASALDLTEIDFVLDSPACFSVVHNSPPMNDLALSKCGLTEAAIECVPLEYFCEVF